MWLPLLQQPLLLLLPNGLAQPGSTVLLLPNGCVQSSWALLLPHLSRLRHGPPKSAVWIVHEGLTMCLTLSRDA